MKKSKAIAIPSGAAAHIYINLQSREKHGVVPEQDYEKVREEIITLFKETETSRTVKASVVVNHMKDMWTSIWNEGLSLQALEENTKSMYSQVFKNTVHPYEDVKRISKKADAESREHNAGDILLMAAPGYNMGSGASKKVKPTTELGTHGGDPSSEKLKAVFLAMGPDVSEAKQLKPISNLDIAPTIYEILGLETPSFVEGERIKDLK